MKIVPVIVLAVVTLAACGADPKPASPKTFDVTGRLVLTGRADLLRSMGGGTSSAGEVNADLNTGRCEGENEFRGLTAGGQVVIKDSAGKLLSKGRLSAGSYEPAEQTGIAVECTFRIYVNKVQAEAGPSGHTVLRSARSPARCSRRPSCETRWILASLAADGSGCTYAKSARCRIGHLTSCERRTIQHAILNRDNEEGFA